MTTTATVKVGRGPGHGQDGECEVRRLYAGIESAWTWCRTHACYIGACSWCSSTYHAQRRRTGYCSSAHQKAASRSRLSG